MAVTAAIIGAGASLVSGAVGANQSKKARNAAARDAKANAKREIEALKASRQTPIINPYMEQKT